MKRKRRRRMTSRHCARLGAAALVLGLAAAGHPAAVSAAEKPPFALTA